MILLIDNFDSFTYNLYQLIVSEYENVIVKRNDEISLNEIKQLQPKGIIISPGPGRPENAGICIPLICAIIAGHIRSTPLLGVCLGHQAIVSALRGNVVQANEIVHGKADDIYHHQSGLYQNLPNPFKAARYHSLMAERQSLPSSLKIDAENDKKCIMGISHCHLPLYGFQFHPESILTPLGKLLIKEFLAICLGLSAIP